MVGKFRIGMLFLTLNLILVSLTVSPYISSLATSNPEFRLDMDSLNLQKGVSYSIVVSLINANDAEIISIEGIDNFDVISSSQSSYTSINNNVSTYKLDLKYVIIPKTTGEFTLKANIKYNGQVYETNSLDVTVTENSSNNNGAVADLFVKTILSHKEAYLGEKLVLTYEVYSRFEVDGLGFRDNIAIDGTVMKELTNDQITSEYVYIEGNGYTKYIIKQFIIDPINSGIFTIPSFSLQVNVMSEDDSFGIGFPGFGMNSITPKYLQTDELSLQIKPLPTEGRPTNFSGIVGELNLNSSYSRNEVNYGDSIALQVEAFGNCNLDGFKNIIGNDVTNFTVYETPKDIVESIEDNKYHINKLFEAILIPEKTGELKIAPISISYFNTITERYELAEVSGTDINVLGNMPIINVNETDKIVDYETILINQISYGDTNQLDDYITVRLPKMKIYTILVAVVLLVLIIIFMFLFLPRMKKQDSELKLIYKKILATDDINEIYNLFNSMIKHCYNLNIKALPKSTILSNLSDNELGVLITDIMDYMESLYNTFDKSGKDLKSKIKKVYVCVK